MEKSLFVEDTFQDGVIRLSKWPEGYVLWYHGEIVWKSWDRLDRGKIQANHFRQQLEMIAEIGGRPETTIHDQQVKRYSAEAVRLAKNALSEDK